MHAFGKTFHVEHFNCAACGCQFGLDGYFAKDGLAYCRTDFLRLFGPQCRGCGQSVQSSFLSALGHTWDRDCFVCGVSDVSQLLTTLQDCRRPLADGAFFEWQGSALCERCLHSRRGSICAACQQPIVGRCVLALDKHFHPEHFACAECRRQVTRATYKEVGGRPLCQKCAQRLQPPIQYVQS